MRNADKASASFVVFAQLLFLVVMLAYLLVVLVMSLWKGCLINYDRICLNTDVFGFIFIYMVQFVAAVVVTWLFVRILSEKYNRIKLFSGESVTSFFVMSAYGFFLLVGKLILAIFIFLLAITGLKLLI